MICVNCHFQLQNYIILLELPNIFRMKSYSIQNAMNSCFFVQNYNFEPISSLFLMVKKHFFLSLHLINQINTAYEKDSTCTDAAYLQFVDFC